MNYGDSYQYQVQFGASGEVQVVQSTAKVARSTKAAADASELWIDKQGKLRNQLGQFATDAQRAAAAAGAYGTEVQQAAVASMTAAKASRQAAVETARFGGGGRGAAQNLMQLTYVIDDMQWGVRGLQNQIPMVTTALFGFGVAGAAAGAAGTILAGVFRKQIDEGLAWAGVLDENVVKGLNLSEEASKHLSKSVSILGDSFAKTSDPIGRFIEQQEQAAKATVNLDVVMQASARSGEQIEEAIAKEEERLRELNKQLKQTEAMMGAAFMMDGGGGGAMAAHLAREIEKVTKNVEDLGKELETVRGAGADAQNRKQIEAIERQQKGLKALARVHEEIDDQQRQRWRDAEEERQKEVRQIFEVMAAEQQAEDERQKRVMDRQQQAARAQLDDRARRVVEAFGPQVQGGIQQGLQAGLNRGQSVDQSADRVFADLSRLLQRAGVEGGAADQAARQLVDEQARQFQAMTDANAAGQMLQREQLQNTGMMLQLFDAKLQQDAAMLREVQRQRDRLNRTRRHLRPFGFMQGNPVNGRF